MDPIEQERLEIIKNMPEPKITMGDDETIVQLVKIALGVICLVVFIFLLWHLHMDLLRMEKNQLEIIKILSR